MELKSTMRYFNEYLYQQAIQELNAKCVKENKSVIPVSQARSIHEDLLLNVDMEKAGPKAFCSTVNELLSDYSDEETVLDKAKYDTYVDVFKQTTGLGDNGKKNSYPMLPLSPYDERFANNATFLLNGSNLLYARGKDIEELGENFNEDMPVYRQTENGYRKAGTAQTKDDMSGMSKMMRYMSQSEYTDVADWVNAVGLDDESKYMSKKAVDRTCALLEHLQNEGVEYTIARDENPGQIKAMLTGTKISVRLTDSRANENFIGRVYDNGVAIYYTTDKRVTGSTKTKPYENASAEDCIRLIDFARGKSVTRQDVNKPAGVVDQYNESFYTKAGKPVSTQRLYNMSYHTNRNYSEVVGPYPGDATSHVLLHVDSSKRTSAMKFRDIETAELFLRNAVTSARENFAEAVAIDELIDDAKAHAGDANYEPDFSGDMTIASLQRSYWDVLTGKKSALLRPDVTADDYEARLNDLRDANIKDENVRASMLSDLVYDGSPEEQVRKHMLDNIDYTIGTFEPSDDEYSTGKRFDPVNVAAYMTSEASRYSNSENIVSALRIADISSDELRGNSFYNENVANKLIKFDEKSARPMATIANPFMHTMFDTIKTTLTETGCTVNDRDILIDDNGIVHYKANRMEGVRLKDDGSSLKPVEGEIGQIFMPDDMGLVETKFAGSENYLFTPGYEAYVVPQKFGEEKSMEERTRLKGYEQIMADNIRYQLRSDIILNSEQAGNPTSVNGVYKKLYDTRYSLDLVERAREDRMSDDLLHDIIKTNASRVRYSNEFKEGSTINADYQANLAGDNIDAANDNFHDCYSLTGRRNMSIMTHESDGYFDPSATGTSTNQGITRYLVESASVNPDGSIKRGALDDKTAIMKNEVCKYMDYVPFDRRQMTFNNLLKASCVTDKVNTAQMTFGGWGFDDGYVVSKEFAEKYQIRDSEGKMRNLIKGDKISDMNGNKGVISLVVDRGTDIDTIASKVKIREDTLKDIDEMTSQGVCSYNGQDYDITLKAIEESNERQAAEQIQKALGFEKCEEAIQWFKANPDLEVVGAPFPAPSRFNGGSARELMEQPHDLIAPDGTVHEGCMGETHYIVTHMAVDEKTHIYDDEALAAGKGRKASAQLAWALAAQGATNVLDELYHTNTSSTANLREMMITMGLDMDEIGNMRVGYNAQEGEKREVFEMPELLYRESMVKRKGKDGTTQEIKEQRLDTVAMKRNFSNVISQAGGFLEVPFQLTYPTGEKLMELHREDGDKDKIEVKGGKVNYTKATWTRKGKDGKLITVHRNQDLLDGKTETIRGASERDTKPERKSYALPVLSSYLRSGQEFADGTSTVHDYTNHYLKVYEASAIYLDAEKRGDKVAMANATKTAQDAYDKITNDLKTRKFQGKHNYFRDNIMANKLTNSSTAVWTADPRLNIDEIAMNQEMADKLGSKDGYVLVWRDPVLRDAGVRYLKIKIDNTLTGVAINPAMDKSFDGDFDGDSIGLKALQTKSAQREAKALLSVEANLLDLDVMDENGKHELMMQNGLDMKSAAFVNPELVARRKSITENVNAFEKAGLDAKSLQKKRKQAVKDLSEYVKDSFKDEYGNDMISYKDIPSHIKSVEHMVIDGAKGSYSKLNDYAKYLGVSFERTNAEKNPEQPIDLSTVKDLHVPSATREDDEAVEFATAVKAFGTGVAGMYSQRGISVLRNQSPKEILAMTYPVTQSILQSKHDPIEARHKYEMLMGTCRHLWRGEKLEHKTGEDGDYWTVVKDEKGYPMQATKSEFISQFTDIYTHPDGLGIEINKDYVDVIADKLTDEKTGLMMNIEKDAKEKDASVMDKLAYGGTFDTLVEGAKEGRNLFEGKYNAHFAPSSIRRNVYAKEHASEGAQVKAILKSDTKEGYVPKQKSAGVSVKTLGKQLKQESSVEIENPKSDGPDDNDNPNY